MRRLLAASVLGLALSPACGAPQGQRPRDALSAFADALDRGDYQGAYQLMSTRYRVTHTEHDFVAAMEEDPADARRTARWLREGLDDLEVHAELTYGLGETVDLVIDHGRWRLDSDPLGLYAQDTPRDALRAFLHAVDRKRYDVLLRLVPDAVRAGQGAGGAPATQPLTPASLQAAFEARQSDLQQVVQALRENVDAPIEETGDRARMPYGDRYEVRFVREDGVWKISRFE